MGTLSIALLALADWPAEAGMTHGAMESPAAYWQPVCALLAGPGQVLLGSAAHGKRVPERKTEKADARWLARCIPPQAQRERRELTG